METYDVPCWMILPMWENGLGESDPYMYGAGRALGFIGTAATALQQLDNKQKEAEYHAYAGVSAARTAIDASACWLNLKLQIGQKNNSSLDLSKKGFRTKIAEKLAPACAPMKGLGTLAKEIDQHRQRAQHRDGLPLSYHGESTALNHPGGWYLVTAASQYDHLLDLPLCDLLRSWRKQIEQNLFSIHHELMCPNQTAEDSARAKEHKRMMESIGLWTAPLQMACQYHS